MSTAAVEAEFLRWVASDRFSCLGARAAVRRRVMRIVHPGPLAEAGTTVALHDALHHFVNVDLGPTENFAALVAIFTGPLGLSEEAFDGIFWRQLQALHDLDAQSYPWAEGLSDDPQSPEFSFSVIGQPFFVVGMHARAGRISRRFRLPAIAFNSHHQFDRLRANGTYAGLKSRIRAREVALQETLNINLGDFGQQSDARQYSGRPTDDQWRCPFSPRSAGSH